MYSQLMAEHIVHTVQLFTNHIQPRLEFLLRDTHWFEVQSRYIAQ